jgi:hypothetical protein
MTDSADNPPPTDATTSSGQNLVDDVLREAESLLAGAHSSDSEPMSALDPDASLESVDLQALVDRVDGLLGDLGLMKLAIGNNRKACVFFCEPT